MKRRAYPTWFAGGALLLYGVFVLLPSLLGFGYSFTDWSAYSKTLHWVGLDNFATILDPSGDYVSAIEHTDPVHDRDDDPQDGHRARPGDPSDRRA